MQVAGRCFTITETTQTFKKNANLRLTLFFRPNVSIGKVLGCFSFGETVSCNSNLQPAGDTHQLKSPTVNVNLAAFAPQLR